LEDKATGRVSTKKTLGLSLALALVVNAVVAIGAAAAATRVTEPSPDATDIVVSSLSPSDTLKLPDLIAVTNQVNGEAAVSPIARRTEPVSLGGTQATITVEGVRANFARLADWHVDQGSFFTSQDEAALNAVAVVSQSLDSNASVGDTIQISGKPFTIVGLGSGGPTQNVVLVPLRTAQIRLFGANALDAIYLQPSSAARTASVTQEVEAVLRQRHNLRAGQSDDFTISDAPLGADSSAQNGINGTRVLQVIQQFGCSAKNTCPRS
jgi:putative ABC transport system permease protein